MKLNSFFPTRLYNSSSLYLPKENGIESMQRLMQQCSQIFNDSPYLKQDKCSSAGEWFKSLLCFSSGMVPSDNTEERVPVPTKLGASQNQMAEEARHSV